MQEPGTAVTDDAPAGEAGLRAYAESPSRPVGFRALVSSSINRKIGIAFAALLLVALINAAIIHATLERSHGDAAMLNAAGKLRYLSQQIGLNAATSLGSWSPGTHALEAGVYEYEMALTALTAGGRVLGHEVKPVQAAYPRELSAIQQDWQMFRQRIASALSAGSGLSTREAMAQISVASQRMLEPAERLVQAMTIDAQRRQEQNLLVTYVLLAVDTLLLWVFAVVVNRQIVVPLRQLVFHSRQLAEGNYRARVDYRAHDEIGLLVQAFNHAAASIGSLVERIEQEQQSLIQAEVMFRGLAENSVAGVYIAQDGRFRFSNAKMADMFGYDPGQLAGSRVLSLVPAEEQDLVRMSVDRRVRGEVRGIHYERHGLRKDGSTFDVEVFGSTMMLDGRPATIGILLDITERKATEASMRLASLVYDNSGEGITITDGNGTIIDVNPAFTRITGYARREAIGARMSLVSSGRHDRDFYEAMWHALSATGRWQGEIWNRRKSGELYAEWLSIDTSYRPDGTVDRRIGLFSDITHRKRAEELVWKQANFDALTGLPNRLMFRDRLEQEMRKAHRAGLVMALMFIDLDRFKEVNDSLGHDLGDSLLKQASLRITNCVRESDTVARLGGDEFTVILGELSASQQVERVAQQILQKLGEPFVLGDEAAFVTASIGITFYPDDAAEIDELLKNADQAMYSAKEEGRNCFNYFTPSMQERARERRELARDIHRALAGRQLQVHFQPIVHLRTGTIRKAEALLRWEHPERGLLDAAEFISIAEETGQIAEIGDWVFRQVVSQLVSRQRTDPHFQVCMNTSPVQYKNGGIRYAEWFELLADFALPTSSVALEITEGLILDASISIPEQLLRFRDAGMAVALDDFGTGYSSLACLSRLEIDYLKIDRSFVQDADKKPETLVLCEAIIVMAHKLGIQVVAEGIETAAQRDALERVGCDYGQGRFFSTPVPAERFEAMFPGAGMLEPEEPEDD